MIRDVLRDSLHSRGYDFCLVLVIADWDDFHSICRKFCDGVVDRWILCVVWKEVNDYGIAGRLAWYDACQ